MATRDITTDDQQMTVTQPVSVQREETKASFLTTEFWAMIGVIAAILVAGAQADNFDAPRAWTLVAAVAIGSTVLLARIMFPLPRSRVITLCPGARQR